MSALAGGMGDGGDGGPDGEVLLRVRHLDVEFASAQGPLHALSEVSLELRRSRTLAIVGESGSGKSVLARAILRLLGPAARTAPGSQSQWQILLREIAPKVAAPLLSYALTITSVMIVAEGSLSFLGVGVAPPTPSWGGMIAEGRESLERVPHVSLIPAGAMFLTVLSLNLLGDGLRQRRGGAA